MGAIQVTEQTTIDEETVASLEIGNALIARNHSLNPGLAIAVDVNLTGAALERLQWLASHRSVSIERAIQLAINADFFLQSEAIAGSEFFAIEQKTWVKELIFP